MSRMGSTLLYAVISTTLLFSAQTFAAINDSGVKVRWGYKGSIGPEFWGRLNPDYLICAEGKTQSPIDIAHNDITVKNTLVLHYHPVDSEVLEDTVTKLTIKKDLTIYNDGHTIQVNFANKKTENYVMYEGERYDLVQFHFHSPSENQLNGESAPLEVHFVHQGKGGKVLVIGVLIKGGSANPTLQNILEHMPDQEKAVQKVKGELINPMELLPLDNDYYSFQGSLTTPPCSEGLNWVVMASLITASPAQIAKIRAEIGGSNARAVQPLNKRVIAYAMEKSL